jgi:hypothetical protein
LQDPEQRTLMELLCSGQLRELYSDQSLDKRGRDARMFSIRDDVILKLRELKPAWDPVILNEVNFLLYSIQMKASQCGSGSGSSYFPLCWSGSGAWSNLNHKKLNFYVKNL